MDTDRHVHHNCVPYVHSCMDGSLIVNAHQRRVNSRCRVLAFVQAKTADQQIATLMKMRINDATLLEKLTGYRIDIVLKQLREETDNGEGNSDSGASGIGQDDSCVDASAEA